MSDTLIGEDLEDLLKSSLRDTVLLNAEVLFLELKLAEEPANCLVLFGHSELEELAALLQDLDLAKVAKEETNYLDPARVGLYKVKQVAQADTAIGVKTGLGEQVVTHSIFADLVQNQVVDSVVQILNGIHQVDLAPRILVEAELLAISLLIDIA